MIAIRIADLNIGIDNKYDYLPRFCRDYLLPDGAPLDFSVSVTEEEIDREAEGGDFSRGYCESICAYRKIVCRTPAYRVFLMHGAVICDGGNAYIFTAQSGTGKSTHLSLWKKNFPETYVLNGDKPLIRMCDDGTFLAYGTPWCGKEGWGINASAPVGGICFLDRGAEDSIRPSDGKETVARLLHQLYFNDEKETVVQSLSLFNELVKRVPFFVLTCTVSDRAAQLSHHALTGK